MNCRYGAKDATEYLTDYKDLISRPFLVFVTEPICLPDQVSATPIVPLEANLAIDIS